MVTNSNSNEKKPGLKRKKKPWFMGVLEILHFFMFILTISMGMKFYYKVGIPTSSKNEPHVNLVGPGVLDSEKIRPGGDIFEKNKLFKKADWRSFKAIDDRDVVEVTSLYNLDQVNEPNNFSHRYWDGFDCRINTGLDPFLVQDVTKIIKEISFAIQFLILK